MKPLLCLHTQGMKAQLFLKHYDSTLWLKQSATNTLRVMHPWTIFTAVESVIHGVLSLAGIFTLILTFLHYVWIHVRFHFVMEDWIKLLWITGPPLSYLTSGDGENIITPCWLDLSCSAPSDSMLQWLSDISPSWLKNKGWPWTSLVKNRLFFTFQIDVFRCDARWILSALL